MMWFEPKNGSFGFVIRGRHLQIKAPWAHTFYSERNGKRVPLVKALGWRLFFQNTAK